VRLLQRRTLNGYLEPRKTIVLVTIDASYQGIIECPRNLEILSVELSPGAAFHARHVRVFVVRKRPGQPLVPASEQRREQADLSAERICFVSNRIFRQ
jgi:hypothetical protein